MKKEEIFKAYLENEHYKRLRENAKFGNQRNSCIFFLPTKYRKKHIDNDIHLIKLIQNLNNNEEI